LRRLTSRPPAETQSLGERHFCPGYRGGPRGAARLRQDLLRAMPIY
jgi:hypothetical protein